MKEIIKVMEAAMEVNTTFAYCLACTEIQRIIEEAYELRGENVEDKPRM